MITKRTARMVGLALAESARSTYDRVRIGAVVADGNYVVGRGANLCTSHPLQYRYNNKAGRDAPAHNCHAEMHAIIRACSNYSKLDGCEIFVGRYDRNGRLGMCKPCAACELAIKEHGIIRVTYTTLQGVITEEP